MSETQRTLEARLIAAAWQSKEAMEAVQANLSQYQFTSAALAWVWDKFKTCWAHKETPSQHTLAAMIGAESEQVRPQLNQAITELSSAEPSQSIQSDCGVLLHYHTHGQLTEGMDNAVKAMMSGDLDAARARLEQATKASSAGIPTVKAMNLIDWDDWDTAPEQAEGIPTGIRRLDDELMGGLTRGDLALIFGVTGMGKSLLAINIGYNALRMNLKVIHIDSENGMHLTKCRYLARLNNQLTKALERRRVQTELTPWAQRNKERLDGLLKIMPIGVGSTTFAELKTSVSALVKSGFAPDMVVFDSADHLVKKESDNAAFEVKNQYEGLKGWAQEMGCAMIAVTQAKAEAEGNIATSKSVAWGYDKARIADVIMSINPPMNAKGKPVKEEQMMNGKRTLYVSKARSGASRFMIPMKGKFERAWFQEDNGEDAS